MASANSPCAACKFQRRKCMQECIFAPYFPPDQPEKFANVHRVFGASNVGKILNDLPPAQREDAVNSLTYEAEARLRDPIYGCVGFISVLQHRLKQVQHDLFTAKKELATYIGPSAMHPMLLPTLNPQMLQPHQNPSSSMGPFGDGMSPIGLGLPPDASMQTHLFRDQQQQILEAQAAQMAALAREQELMRSYEQQSQELRYNNGGFDGNSESGAGAAFNHISAGLSSNLDLVTMDNQFALQPQPQQQQQQQEEQLLLYQPQQCQQCQQPTQHERVGSDEGTGGVVISPSS